MGVQKEFLAILPELIKKLQDVPRLQTAMIYGSAARGELKESSDIDLMLIFDIETNPELKELEIAARILSEIQTERKIQIFATNLKESLDTDFVQRILREGIIIFGKPLVVHKDKIKLNPYVLFEYSMKDLSRKLKTNIMRALRGYHMKKGKYISKKGGLLDIEEVRKLGKGVVLVPYEHAKSFQETFEINQAKFSKINLWK